MQMNKIAKSLLLQLCSVALPALFAASLTADAAQPAKTPPTPKMGPVTIAKQGYFFVAGHYGQTKDGQTMTGQMFVQFQIPQRQKHRYPIIMWHGGGQTGTNFLMTP